MGYKETVLARNPIQYYRFANIVDGNIVDENGLLNASYSGGGISVVSGGPAHSVGSDVESCMLINNGTSYNDINIEAGINFEGCLAIEAWLLIPFTASPGSIMITSGWFSNYSGYYTIAIINVNNKYRIRTETYYNDDELHTDTASIDLSFDEWFKVFIVFKEGSTKVYIDDILHIDAQYYSNAQIMSPYTVNTFQWYDGTGTYKLYEMSIYDNDLWYTPDPEPEPEPPSEHEYPIILDSGAVYINYGLANERLLGATYGGSSFQIIQEGDEFEIDGAKGPLKRIKRFIKAYPELRINLIEFSSDTLSLMIPGSKINSGLTFDTITRALENVDLSTFENIAIVAQVSASDECIVCGIRNPVVDTDAVEFGFIDGSEAATEIVFKGQYSYSDDCEPWFVHSVVI